MLLFIIYCLIYIIPFPDASNNDWKLAFIGELSIFITCIRFIYAKVISFKWGSLVLRFYQVRRTGQKYLFVKTIVGHQLDDNVC